MAVVIPLFPEAFPVHGTIPVAACGAMRAEAFRYASGVEALRLTTPRAEVVILPFQGQQVWRAAFDGRELAMRTMFDEPVATDQYLATYGAFFLHCGITRMGPPAPNDPHPLHGELPLARFDTAELVIEEAAGRIALRGLYRHRIGFGAHYAALAEVLLGAEATLLDVTIEVKNRQGAADLELMYLGHANFRAIDHARLVYAARYTPKDVAVRRSIPPHITPGPGYVESLADLARDPALHHVLDPALPFDPEVAITVKMLSDADGWSHAMQVHPGGPADVISYDASTLPLAIRWICRTADQAAIGIALPATAGVEGYVPEKAAGRIVTVPPGGRWRAAMPMGALSAQEAAEMETRIERIAGRS